HVAIRGIEMDRAPAASLGAARAGYRDQAVEEIPRLFRGRARQRRPAGEVDLGWASHEAGAEALVRQGYERAPLGRRAYPVAPGALVVGAPGGEPGPVDLLRVEPERRSARAVLMARERARDRFGFERIAKSTGK